MELHSTVARAVFVGDAVLKLLSKGANVVNWSSSFSEYTVWSGLGVGVQKEWTCSHISMGRKQHGQLAQVGIP
jgi:hypothetical protein